MLGGCLPAGAIAAANFSLKQRGDSLHKGKSPIV
ncbi:hypothetical protein GFC29_2960 [Anoxybacillus sp. B7M1]|nr:hypothetical protein GFC28_2475 [Anoxybacillus sp. B2M1]ANB63333.1 hypothetical protein GFC29_2960 [Anoxybacillus sp. B7M1]KXG09467.1 hypothetical protein AT864_02186 [Anoxybacillus sp. P3H1B]MBB3908811.1 hypothetical protein [Anoxybacillus rupiensis]